MSFSKYLARKPSSLKIGKEISRGGNGAIYEGELGGRPVAVKKIHGILLEAVQDGQGDGVLTSFRSECTRLENIVHPLIVGFKGAFYDQHSNEPLLVMEKMNQDLRELLRAKKGKLAYRRQFQLCQDVAKGIHFLHTQDPPLVHRDLSAKNILLDESGRAKIGDLGQSKLKSAAYFQTKQPGAVPYMPPEALAAKPRYDEKIDIFSYGVLMLEIATQHEPNPGLQNIGSVPEKDRRQADLAFLPNNYPLRPLILWCLNDDPKQRPDTAAVLKELEKENPLKFQEAKNRLSAGMKTFLELLNRVQAFSKQVQDCPTAELTTLSEIQNSLQKMIDATERVQMKVVFLGNTSNGKSTILNALVKQRVLPVGNGSITSCFCTITGIPPGERCNRDGYMKTGSVQRKLPAVKELSNCMKEGSLKAGDILQIFLPAQDSCMWLNQDVVLIDSTGLSADAEVDELIRKTCGDADVFVYVCNGTSTLEEPVKKFLEHVNHQLPNLSKNLFILFNHWDQVVDEDEDSDSDDSDGDDAVTKQDSESVKEQHLQKVHKFLVQGLKADAVLDRTFFVSGKEVCKAQENEKKGKPSADCKVLKRKWQERWTEFRRFESMLHEFLSGSAIRTKCGRHWESCTEFMRQLIAMIEQFKQWLHGEVYKLNEKVKYKKSLLMKIDDSERKLQRMSSEKVQSAMEEFGGVFDKLYEKMKEDLRGKVEVYRDRLDKEKWSDYQKGMIEDLDKGMKDLMQPLEQQMRTFAMDKLKPLQESYAKLTISIDESHAQGEQESLSLEQPTCTDMTKRYRARPWLGREVLDTSVAMLCEYFWEPDGSAKTEVITVDGEEHVVQKRDQHSLGADISVASYLIGVSTLFPPLGVLTLSAFGLDWAADDDKLHREQVKGKIIKRLRKQLDARKQTVKSQCMDNLQSRLESQVKYFNAAVTDRKKVLKEQIHNMQQRIAERHTWIAKATNHLDQLQQEVKPCLDRFYTMYLQGESA